MRDVREIIGQDNFEELRLEGYSIVPEDALQFDCTYYPEMESRVIECCGEISGMKGQEQCLPDPVRLLEMCEYILKGATT
jgi:hypothetical protein